MSLHKLRYFVAVAENQSFSRAAATLHVAQSALSRHIAELEQAIGAPLLERSANGVHMTPVGRVFFDDARDALAQVENAFGQARLAAAGSVGSLTIGVNELSVRHPTIVWALAEFVRLHPAVLLKTTMMTSIEQFRALRNHQIEAGVVIERPAAMNELDHLSIGRDDFVLAMPKDHPLAVRQTLSVADIMDELFVAISAERHWLSQSKLLTRCHACGFTPRPAVHVDSERLQIALIREGIGLGFVNMSACYTLPADIVLRRVDELQVALDLDLVWMRQNGGGLVGAFRNLVASRAGETAEVA
ncbi:DNA-binding transcriptional LysR family regulator [Sphingobium sp. OAS761]|uniref:LysR family transcriptional regulator n=1 Tax=Sphingobium sp. OAS761 TaxID=2817901 RepID=UPI00209DA1FA|nr:LysR family transcriptional regulator [Sphingobium sp. OAS761]MCP1468600.1 DNA-binding transcriptional LysR family regulator [Sphingobium sp. OAS761]